MIKLSLTKNKVPHTIPDLNQITKDQKRWLQKQKIMICTPFYGGAAMGNYLLSLSSVMHWAGILGITVQTQFLFTGTYLELSRNYLANTFWKSDCTHLFWWDGDNGAIANHFFELLLADMPIIGGLYTRRLINWKAVHAAVQAGVPAELLEHCSGSFPMHPLPGHDIVMNHEPQQVLTMPTGFLCTKREVYETYVKAYPERKTTEGAPGHYGIEFFRAGTFGPPKSRGFDSEDNIFCKDMYQLGVNTYMAPWVQVSHYGQHLFNACLPCSTGSYVHLEGWLEKNGPVGQLRTF